MREHRDAAEPFVRDRGLARRGAARSSRDNPFKVELIEDLPEDETITTYQQGAFLDLCRGPHVRRRARSAPFKLLSVAGAYWRGDEKRPMLQRIYGTAWPTQEELDALPAAARRSAAARPPPAGPGARSLLGQRGDRARADPLASARAR